jgi:hypothetical protein
MRLLDFSAWRSSLRGFVARQLSIVMSFCLLLLPPFAHAETWTDIPAKGEDGSSLSVDLQSRKRKSNKVTITYLTEYLTPRLTSGNYYSSSRAQIEFDCSSPTKLRAGPFFEYEGHGGKGVIVHGFDQWSTEWLDLLPNQRDLIALREIACSEVVAPMQASQGAEPFEGVWAKTQKECLDPEGPNSRTLIDLRNLIESKPAPIVDRYENHCLIDRITKAEKSTALDVTCYEFWEDLSAKRDARRATVTLGFIGSGRLKIDGAAFLRCPR